MRELLKFVPPGAGAIPAAAVPQARAERAWLRAELEGHLAPLTAVVATLTQVQRIVSEPATAQPARPMLGVHMMRLRQGTAAWASRGRSAPPRLA
jgi:hypothetical protein